LGRFSGSSSGLPSAEAVSGWRTWLRCRCTSRSFGWTVGALALAVAASTGRRTLATGTAAAFAVLGFLVNGFAPLVDAITWLKYLSLFYYYEGHDPIGNGVDASDLAVLAAATIALTTLAVFGMRQRDLRK
jgi:ABC-2 type transport system permease protein